MKVHHVGFLAKNLNKSQARFEQLGYTVSQAAQYDPIRDVNIAFLVNGEYCVELIEPASKESPMYPLLARYKNTPYHICYEVPDLEGAIADLTANGFTVVDAPKEAPCIDGHPVAFLMNMNAGMIELVEL